MWLVKSYVCRLTKWEDSHLCFFFLCDQMVGKEFMLHLEVKCSWGCMIRGVNHFIRYLCYTLMPVDDPEEQPQIFEYYLLWMQHTPSYYRQTLPIHVMDILMSTSSSSSNGCNTLHRLHRRAHYDCLLLFVIYGTSGDDLFSMHWRRTSNHNIRFIKEFWNLIQRDFLNLLIEI